jgi:hypothetical protein
MMRMGSRLRRATGAILAVVTPLLVMTACTTSDSDSGASASSTVTRTSVAVTVTPSSTVAQRNPAGSSGQGGSQDQQGSHPGNESGQPVDQQPDIPGTDNCGAVHCGTDNCNDNCGNPDDVKCTDKINYAGDPRANAEINTIGERDGKCPDPIRPTETTSEAPQPTETTSATSQPPTTTSAVTTSSDPAPTVTSTAKETPTAP